MPRPKKYTDEEVLDEIWRLARELDETPPTKAAMNKHGKHSSKTYQDRWGSWSDAIKAAGFEPRAKGTDYQERPDECPLCTTEQTGLDFHHWRYGDNEVGCYLCRDCHDKIHKGEAGRENVGWLVPCVENLVRLHIEHHGGDSDPDQILDRYNMTDVRDLVERAISPPEER